MIVLFATPVVAAVPPATELLDCGPWLCRMTNVKLKLSSSSLLRRRRKFGDTPVGSGSYNIGRWGVNPCASRSRATNSKRDRSILVRIPPRYRRLYLVLL
jgi:hypothetical protein